MFNRRWETLIQFPDFFDKIMTKSLKFPDRTRQNILAKTLFFCITQPNSEKKHFPQFQCCSPQAQAPCTACTRTALIIGGWGNSWILSQFLSGVVVLFLLFVFFPVTTCPLTACCDCYCHTFPNSCPKVTFSKCVCLVRDFIHIFEACFYS